LVEIDELAVQAATLVEVAAGHLESSGVGKAARLQRLEAGGTGQPFDRRRSRVVVGRVEEHRPLRLATCRAREGVRAECAECLYVVRACGEESGDHRAGRLSFGKCPDHLPALVEPERVRGVDDDLVLEQARVRCDQFLDRVEPDGEDDGVGVRDRLFDRGSARELT
jgi:hypothetical protein